MNIGIILSIIGLCLSIISIILYYKAKCIKIKKFNQQDEIIKQCQQLQRQKQELEKQTQNLKDNIPILVNEYHTKKYDLQRQYLNKVNQLEKEYSKKENLSIKDYNDKIEYLKIQYNDQKKDLQALNNLIQQKRKDYQNYYQTGKKAIDQKLQDYKTAVNKAANTYADGLQDVYKTAEARYKERITGLEEAYNEAAASLNNLKETRKAAYEAILKQQEVKQNKDAYRLLPSIADLQDIRQLETIRLVLHKPRVLSMLIWQSYWQPLAKKQFPLILKDATRMGIYKITNLQTNECYIGQAVDIYKRWCQHCKAGLGIDTPTNNKLYKAIQNFGLENFTFEILCQCYNTSELNEKERYFIELYQADIFGYNSQKGNK